MKNNICVGEVDNGMKKRCSANKRKKQNAKIVSKPSSKDVEFRNRGNDKEPLSLCLTIYAILKDCNLSEFCQSSKKNR